MTGFLGSRELARTNPAERAAFRSADSDDFQWRIQSFAADATRLKELVDDFHRIARGYHRHASCRHSRILHDQPLSPAQTARNAFNAIVPHVYHEQPAQKANDPQCASPTRRPFLRVSSRGQAYNEPQGAGHPKSRPSQGTRSILDAHCLGKTTKLAASTGH